MTDCKCYDIVIDASLDNIVLDLSVDNVIDACLDSDIINLKIDNPVDISQESIDLCLCIDNVKLDADLGIVTERIIQGDTRLYNGPYEVIPRIVEQQLDTSQRYLMKDVTVHKIQTYETDNDKGTTIIIGDI